MVKSITREVSQQNWPGGRQKKMEVTVKLNLYHCHLKAVSQLSTGREGGGGGFRARIECFLSSGCTENVPFFFEHFGNVAYSFV